MPPYFNAKIPPQILPHVLDLLANQHIFILTLIIIQGPIAHDDGVIRINCRIRNIGHPDFGHLNDHAYELIQQHGLSLYQLLFDLYILRMFLINGNLPHENI